MIDHRLSLNAEKTKTIFFGTKSKMSVITIYSLPFQDSSIETVDQFKYLGLMLDSKLTFSKHVEYICKKVYPKLRTMGCVGQGEGRLAKTLVYPAHMFTHLSTQLQPINLHLLRGHIRTISSCDACTKLILAQLKH